MSGLGIGGGGLSDVARRMVVPRRVPFRTFVTLTAITMGSMTLCVGLSLGLAYQSMKDQLGTSMTLGEVFWEQLGACLFLGTFGSLVGIAAVAGIARLAPIGEAGGRLSFTGVVLGLLPYAAGGVVGSIATLYVRIVIPGDFAPLTPSANLQIILIIACVWVFLGAVANHLKERAERRDEYQASLRDKIGELEASRRRIFSAHEDARQRIGVDVHGFQSTLYAIIQLLGRCLGNLRTNPDEAGATLARAMEDLEKAKEGLREASHLLYPSILRTAGLPGGLRSLQDRFGVTFDLSLHIDDEISRMEDVRQPSMPPLIRLVFYRFAEEALTNVQKHAKARKVSIQLRLEGNRIVLSVQDNGTGLDAKAVTPGLGMVAMRDMLGAVGGSVQIDSVLGRGTTVTAIVPYAPT